LINEKIALDNTLILGTLELSSTAEVTKGPSNRYLIVGSGGKIINRGALQGDRDGLIFGPESTYLHNFSDSEGVIPLASWSNFSTVSIIGYTSTTEATSAGQWSQSFGNVVWDTPLLTADFFLNGLLSNISGSFTIKTTNGQVLRLTKASNHNLSIGGDFNVDGSARFSISKTGLCNSLVTVSVGGDFNFRSSNPLGSRYCEQGISVFNIAGRFFMNQGLLYFSSGSGGTSSSGADLRVKGDFRLEGGTIDASVAYSNRVGDLFLEGRTTQLFINRGNIVGSFHYHLAPGAFVRVPDGSSFVGNTFECGDLTGGATLIVESSDPLGAIQKGQNNNGSIKVRTQTWRSGSTIIYGGTSPQFIGGDHPSTSGVKSIIDNSTGVSTAATGTTAVCGGDLSIIRGNLVVSKNNLTVRGNLDISGGGIEVNTSNQTSAVALTVDGALVLEGNGMVISSSLTSNTGNTVLNLNGDFRGSRFIQFRGNNSQVNIGGSPRVFSRSFPVDQPFNLESLNLNIPGGNTRLQIDQELVLGNFSTASGYTGGLTIQSGDLKITAPLKIISPMILFGGRLDFGGTSLELQRNIQTNQPNGVLMSDMSSVLLITSAFGGIDNNLAFSGSANNLGKLILDRSAQTNPITGVPITPHIRLKSPLNITGQLFLKDGEFEVGNFLSMDPNASIIRTPDAALAALNSNPPTGGPYHLEYASGQVFNSLEAGPESRGALSTMKVDLGGVVSLNRAVMVSDSLILSNGRLANLTDSLTIGTDSKVIRWSSAEYTGIPPRSGSYDLYYYGQSMKSGNEALGSLNNVVVGVKDSIEILNQLEIDKSLIINSGRFKITGDTLKTGSVVNNAYIKAPAVMEIDGIFDNNGVFEAANGTVQFSGEGQLKGNAPLALNHLTVSGSLLIPEQVQIGGDLRLNGPIHADSAQVDLIGQGKQIISGTHRLAVRDLKVLTKDTVTVQTGINLTGRLKLGDHSILHCGDGLLVLETSPAGSAGIDPIPLTTRLIGQISVRRYMPPVGRDYRYIGSPVSGARFQDLVPCDWFNLRYSYSYEETVLGYKDYGFVRQGFTSPLWSGRGYILMPNDYWAWKGFHWTVKGELKSGESRGDVDLKVTHTFSNPPNWPDDGWNLVANPYPSDIVWSLDPSKWSDGRGGPMVNIHPLIFVKDVSNGTYKTYDASTGIGDLPGGKIALGQAFWIHSTGANPRLVAHEQAKTSQARFYRQSASIYPHLRIILKSDQAEVSSFFVMNSTSKGNIDSHQHGFALPGEKLSVNLRSEDGQSMAHYAISDVTEIPIEIRAPKTSSMSLRFEPASGFNLDDLELVDRELNEAHRITGGSYSFELRDSVSLNRFFIRKRKADFMDTKEAFRLYPNPSADGRFRIFTGGEHLVRVVVRDQLGRMVLEKHQPTPGNELSIEGIKPGVYLVEISTSASTKTIKWVVSR